ncbi:MAG: ABC transporter substrate-binding protein, partial [Flavobacteriaceae bacterium]
MRLVLLLTLLIITGCKKEKDISSGQSQETGKNNVSYATGFQISELENGIKLIRINSPWPNSEAGFVYALIPRTQLDEARSLPEEVDAVIPIPVERLIVTSTTHIPVLEAIGIEKKLIGFPETRYISSPKTRNRIHKGEVAELGSNEFLNTEITIALEPDLVVGFGIDGKNKAYKAIESTGIPVVYNGDWTEETPLGKAEWIKFFAPFFELETKADSIFKTVELSYIKFKKLAQSSQQMPTVLSGALYKDVWYLPAGESWAAKFIEDANADYLWKDTE